MEEVQQEEVYAKYYPPYVRRKVSLYPNWLQNCPSRDKIKALIGLLVVIVGITFILAVMSLWIK